MSDEPPNDDGIDPGKPRKDSRFKSPVSGNPGGRPKGRFKPTVDFMDETITILLSNGKKRRVTRGRLAEEALFKLGIQKDSVPAIKLLKGIGGKPNTKAENKAVIAAYIESQAVETELGAQMVIDKLEAMAERRRQNQEYLASVNKTPPGQHQT